MVAAYSASSLRSCSFCAGFIVRHRQAHPRQRLHLRLVGGQDVRRGLAVEHHLGPGLAGERLHQLAGQILLGLQRAAPLERRRSRTSAGLAPMKVGVVTMVVPFTTVKLNDRWWPSIFQPQLPPGWGLPNTQK